MGHQADFPSLSLSPFDVVRHAEIAPAWPKDSLLRKSSPSTIASSCRTAVASRL
ncbi:hypothetical protein C8T65DRAFT_656726 [Cerioporus squamosus]|nr:hypothetical protein C8T65DRAFT_656726 [Cerioporus squamosus]